MKRAEWGNNGRRSNTYVKLSQAGKANSQAWCDGHQVVWGICTKKSGRELDGFTWDQYPPEINNGLPVDVPYYQPDYKKKKEAKLIPT